jgi:hypothetical protein
MVSSRLRIIDVVRGVPVEPLPGAPQAAVARLKVNTACPFWITVTVRELLTQDVDPVQNGAHDDWGIVTGAPVGLSRERASVPSGITEDAAATVTFAHAVETVVPVLDMLSVAAPNAISMPHPRHVRGPVGELATNVTQARTRTRTATRIAIPP